jgi:hypothetical protein
VLLKRGKNGGIGVYIPKETILKEMAAKIEYIKRAFLFDLVQEFSDSTSYASIAQFQPVQKIRLNHKALFNNTVLV